MTTLDLGTKIKIQSLVEKFVAANADENGFISFDLVKESVISEFGEIAIPEAKKQYDFMFEW